MDLAPVRSGACLVDVQSDKITVVRSWAWSTPRHIEDRLQNCVFLKTLLTKYQPDVVGLEGYTNQSFSHIAFDFGEVGALIRMVLWITKQPTIIIPPQSRFQVVPTKKKDFFNEVVKYWGIPAFTGPDRKAIEDQTDAFVYALIAGLASRQYLSLSNDFVCPSRESLTKLVSSTTNVYWLDRLRKIPDASNPSTNT